MPIRILITGGTFDKIYNPVKEVLEFKETHIPEMLEFGRNRNKVEVEKHRLIDSLQMTGDDRQKILEMCKGCPEEKIVITHGTSTMVETAKLLGQNLKGKTVVLTGASVPYTLNGSDAMFNFAHAFGAVQALPKGVYIAMNGIIFPWDKVRKNEELGEFETIN